MPFDSRDTLLGPQNRAREFDNTKSDENSLKVDKALYV
jgi:hypothetical protein